MVASMSGAVRLLAGGVVLAGLLLGLGAGPALAQATNETLSGIIGRLQGVIVGLLAALATLFLTVGGARYLFAGGDPSQVEKAKVTLKAAAVGYGIAALAAPLFSLLQFIIKG